MLYIQKEGVVMKKILNDVDSVEAEMIQGLVKSAPKMLRKLDYGTIVVRANKKEGKVALVSGGGSGHEPAHAGYVGTGMLDGAVAGTVFTQIVDLRKSTAGLWVIRTVLKMTEVRQFGRLLRFRLDSDSASGRQVQR